jgi:hypothetical protein
VLSLPSPSRTPSPSPVCLAPQTREGERVGEGEGIRHARLLSDFAILSADRDVLLNETVAAGFSWGTARVSLSKTNRSRGGKTPMIVAIESEQGIRPLGRYSVGGANPIA